jgi:predicted CoA-substrate-specific enzyme activase
VSLCLGVDIGSITAKAVLLESSDLTNEGWKIIPSGYNTKETAKTLVDSLLKEKGLTRSDIEQIVSTGYSRKNVDFAPHQTTQTTEITCQAKGIFFLFPEARTIIDIGGQDSKAIKVNGSGQLSDFEMNDKCSAGTGRFLEVMANALQVKLQEMGQLALQSSESVPISSTCTVFAESEVISRIAQGQPREAILRGIHDSIATKTLTLIGKIGISPKVIVTGGVAKNSAVVSAIGEKIGYFPLVPEEPQITAALGAALLAIDRIGR